MRVYEPKIEELTALERAGAEKIAWVRDHMPVLNAIVEMQNGKRILDGLTLSMSIHLEAKTAFLALCMKALGAQVSCAGSNPLSTKDDVCAALRAEGVVVNAHYGENEAEYEENIQKTLSVKPDVILDDGGDLLAALRANPALAVNARGLCEETTTGILRIKQLDAKGELPFAAIDVNGATMKHLFDNRYGTGQSVFDGIMRTTNLIIASKTVVVAGYGWCGRGVAMRAKGLGAKVVVAEVDPAKAVEAVMDGYTVLPMDEAAAVGDLFITVTGCADVITERHFAAMKDGAILCNAGHFDVEVAVARLAELADRKWRARENIEGYSVFGKTLYVLAEGRLVNLAAGDGHPAEIMDLSFSIQLLCIKYLFEHGEMPHRLIPVPAEIDQLVARLKLKTLGVAIDTLSDAQRVYLYGE